MKFVALLVCMSLITVVAAQVLSNTLFVTLDVDDPHYNLSYIVAPPTEITTVEPCEFTVNLARDDTTIGEDGGMLITCETGESDNVELYFSGAFYGGNPGNDPGWAEGLYSFDVNNEILLGWQMLTGIVSLDQSYIITISVTGSYSFSIVMIGTPPPGN